MKEMKYQMICKVVRAQISEGFWKPGSRIYSERQLAELYDVSRLTVKRALSELVSEGLLEYRSGRQGTFVTEDCIQPGTRKKEKSERFIGVAIDNHTPAFASHLLQGIHDALWSNGFHTIYCNTYQENEDFYERIQSLISTSIEGLIYSPVLGPGYLEINKRILESLDEKKIPFVLVDRYMSDRLDNHVVINNRESYLDLVRMLFNKGHRRILFLNGFEASSSLDRLRGFRDAFDQSEIDSSGALELLLDEQELFRTGQVSEDDIGKVEKMGDFTAVIGLNQLLLNAGQQIAKKLDKKVLTAAIVASSNEKVSDIAVVQPVYRMGKEAAELLVKVIEDNSHPVTQLILKAEIQDHTQR